VLTPFSDWLVSQSCVMTNGKLASLFWCQAPVQIFGTVKTDLVFWCGALSLIRGWVCLQLLLAFASTVILGSESQKTHDHILLSQIWESPNMESQVPVFISPRHRVPFLLPVTTRRAVVLVFEPASTQATGNGSWPALYTFEADPTQKTASNSFDVACVI
jgi:hypothetical protein